MIVIKVKGGLGNQLFQYTLGVYIEEQFDIPVKYDISYFNIKHRIDTPRVLMLPQIIKDFHSKVASNADISKIKFHGLLNKTSWGEYLDHINLIINKRYNKSYFLQAQKSIAFNELIKFKYLDGYWQDSSYVLTVISSIRSSFNKDFIKKLSQLEPFPNLNTDADVCIHVRRGDYVTKAAANSTHGVCTDEYYLSGISHFKRVISQPRFFFFSDDMVWVKKTFGINENYIFIDLNSQLKDLAEFFMMTRFKQFVIANSTYSWWAAVIAQSSSVIAPKKWFANGENQLALNGWILI